MSWEDLQEDILEEFGSFTHSERRGDLVKAGFAVKRRVEREGTGEAQSGALRNRRAYARAVAAGKCVKCPRRSRERRKLCAPCASTNKRERARKPHGVCRKCPAPARAGLQTCIRCGDTVARAAKAWRERMKREGVR